MSADNHRFDDASLNDHEFMRYSRQILLPEVGEVGQISLRNRHVVIIGIGGLGNMVAQYLAAAGVGRLTLVDDDTVELSNLPRQLLFNQQDIGQFKSIVAKAKFACSYTSCKVLAMTEKFTPRNASSLLKGAALVLDCTDDFNTRHLVNLSCIAAQVPLISASVAHFMGQILVVDLQQAPQSGCYACLFPEDMLVAKNCRTAGVLGPMVGVMASMQALMATNVLLGIGQPGGKLLRFDGKAMSWQAASLTQDPSCRACRSHANTPRLSNNSGRLVKHATRANEETSYEPS